jgi:hypothetical protein
MLAFETRPGRMFSDASANLEVAIMRVNDSETSFGTSYSKSGLINATAVDKHGFCTTDSERD